MNGDSVATVSKAKAKAAAAEVTTAVIPDAIVMSPATKKPSAVKLAWKKLKCFFSKKDKVINGDGREGANGELSRQLVQFLIQTLPN